MSSSKPMVNFYQEKNSMNFLRKNKTRFSYSNSWKRIIQKLRNAKFLNINILSSPDTYTDVSISGGYSMLMLKNFELRNFRMNPKAI